MEIALVIYPINDYGGIINHVENLAWGLRELGHRVSLHSLHWQNSVNEPMYPPAELRRKGWVRGAFGYVHQQSGWTLYPWDEKLPYKRKADRIRVKKKLSKYDLVIWEIPVPTKIKQHRGNMDWIELYDACDKNIAIIHDGNLRKTPWICEIKDKLIGLACVHECAYNTARSIDVPRALILNPQDLTGVEEVYNYYDEGLQIRKPGFLSLQVFKGWKHVDSLIRAIPYMHRDMKKYMAGGGIEQRYMVGKITKERYTCRKREDKDIPLGLEETEYRIWDRAVNHGMKWFGFITPLYRDALLRMVRTIIDPSYSTTYSANGSHFNRTIVDGIKQGTIPIAVNLGMSNDVSGEGILFKPKKNYVMIPYNTTPKEYACIVNGANSMSNTEALTYLENNYKLLMRFDRRRVAQDFIDLAKEKKCGLFNKRRKGKMDKEMLAASGEEIENFFDAGVITLEK